MPDPARPIRAVAFDMDGLIFDTEAVFVRIATEAMAARGKVFTAGMMAAMIGRPGAVAGPALVELAGLDEDPAAVLAELRGRLDAVIETAVHPMPGLFALLARLEHRRIPRAVATSTRHEPARRLLERHGLMPHFRFVLGGDEVRRGKPDPEIYRTAAARLGVDPPSLLVLEDSPAGVTAAKAAGAFVVAVPHEHSPAAGVSHADRIVDRLDDPGLLGLIERWGTADGRSSNRHS